MVDAALIQKCSDPSLKPAIVEAFVERAGSEDPLAITVRSGNRVVLVPKPTTPEAAMELIRQHIGRNTVRVGIAQYPAGLGIMQAGELKPDLVDACKNLRMGTALFAKVHRIVMKWYGIPSGKDVPPEVLDDAILAWQTGFFEGEAVFRTPDPGRVEGAEPGASEDVKAGDGMSDGPGDEAEREPADDPPLQGDPNKAGIRIDLSGIEAK
ncbi:TraH family protein [Sinorhizobium saheli]|uniref:Conjugal transfer protein TraH n=1 Tax=Sinorhizobium saheli TaxID=36856 RepID=A0A178XWS7_SINSA|nr:TraH family protein [Sinorhizobium saheli]MQW86365.1 conjugal transfer protein TraH [Sinorhizobium saheli]OAP39667.1 conjugal transfer protein TraH [Sinorhizobium saheli]